MPATITRGKSHTARPAAEVTAEEANVTTTEENNGHQNVNARIGSTDGMANANDGSSDVLTGLLTDISFPKAARGGRGKTPTPMDDDIVAMLEQSLNAGGFRLFKGTNAQLVSTLTGPSATPAKWLKATGRKTTHRLEVTNITPEILEDNPALKSAVGDAPMGTRSVKPEDKNKPLVAAWRVVKK